MRTAHALLLLLVLSLAGPSALAAGGTPPSPETTAMTDKSRQLYEEGLAAYKKGRGQEAHASFLAAWSLKKHWQIAANLADIELELGKNREAAEHATYYQKNTTADRHDKAEALVKRALAQVGTLVVNVDTAGADVLIDDALAGRAPLEDPVFVEPGEHRVLARLPGRADAAQVVTLAAGGSQTVSLKLLAPSPPPLLPPAAAGPNKAIVIAGAVVTGVGAVTGVVLAVLSHGKGSDADAALANLTASGGNNLCQTSATACTTIHNDRLAHDALAKGTVGAFVGAGAIGIATLSYALLARRGSTSTGVKVMPTVGSNGAGMAVMGAW